MNTNRYYIGGFFLVLSIFSFWNCDSTTYPQGMRLYEFHCSSCHMSDGTGLVTVNPPLAKSDYLSNHRLDIPCIIRNGISGPMEVNGMIYNRHMEGNEGLSEFEITNICNYMYAAWGNELPPTNIKEVRNALANCK